MYLLYTNSCIRPPWLGAFALTLTSRALAVTLTQLVKVVVMQKLIEVNKLTPSIKFIDFGNVRLVAFESEA